MEPNASAYDAIDMAVIDDNDLNIVRWELRQIAKEARRLASDLDSPELQKLQDRLVAVLRRLDHRGSR